MTTSCSPDLREYINKKQSTLKLCVCVCVCGRQKLTLTSSKSTILYHKQRNKLDQIPHLFCGTTLASAVLSFLVETGCIRLALLWEVSGWIALRPSMLPEIPRIIKVVNCNFNQGKMWLSASNKLTKPHFLSSTFDAEIASLQVLCFALRSQPSS